MVIGTMNYGLAQVDYSISIKRLIDVLAPLQHAIDEASELVSHRGDGFRRAEFAAEAAILGDEVALASQQRVAASRNAVAARLIT